jgi:Zn-dependent peptidase ImmA (M78 family)/transcriptional regulator with XRE-family HTH domain
MTGRGDHAPFWGARLRVARTFAGLTLAELGEQVCISHSAVHHFEAGVRMPSEDVVAALAEATGFASEFFRAPLKDEFREDECFFRSGKMTVSLRTRVLSHGTLFGEAVRFVAARCRLPTPVLPSPRASSTEEIEETADAVRRTWGLGLDRPIANVCRLVEHHGVVVTRFRAASVRVDSLKVDAFSRSGPQPVIVLNTEKDSTSRNRWDLAHELGHLALHAGLQPGQPALEDAANQFAAALLMPRVGFLREFQSQSRLNWDVVFAFKRRWKVSAAAIVRRAFSLGRLDALEYRRAWKHYMYRSWHKGEPNEPDDEPPELMQQALGVIEKTHAMMPGHIAAALGWKPSTFEQVVGVPASIKDPDVAGGNVVPIGIARRRPS